MGACVCSITLSSSAAGVDSRIGAPRIVRSTKAESGSEQLRQRERGISSGFHSPLAARGDGPQLIASEAQRDGRTGSSPKPPSRLCSVRCGARWAARPPRSRTTTSGTSKRGSGRLAASASATRSGPGPMSSSSRKEPTRSRQPLGVADSVPSAASSSSSVMTAVTSTGRPSLMRAASRCAGVASPSRTESVVPQDGDDSGTRRCCHKTVMTAAAAATLREAMPARRGDDEGADVWVGLRGRLPMSVPRRTEPKFPSLRVEGQHQPRGHAVVTVREEEEERTTSVNLLRPFLWSMRGG